MQSGSGHSEHSPPFDAYFAEQTKDTQNQAVDFPLLAACAFFLVVPFTWSALTSVGGFLIRPSDIAGLLIILIVALTGKVNISGAARPFFWLFVSYIGFITLSGIAIGDPFALRSVAKIGFYLATVVGILTIMSRSQMIVSPTTATLIVLFIGLILLANYTVINEVQNTFFNAALVSSKRGAYFLIWNTVFSNNFFGPNDLLEVKGVSFRNTAGIGFLALFLFLRLLSGSRLLLLAMQVALFLLAFAAYSRVVWICLAVFILLEIGALKLNWKVAILAVLGVGVAYLVTLGYYDQFFASRINSNFGRVEQYTQALDLINQRPIFGFGAEASVMHSGKPVTIHNVYLAAWAQFGVMAFFAAVSISLFCLYCLGRFGVAWIQTGSSQERRKLAVYIVATMVVLLRPALSPSVESFFGIGEWACIVLMLYGLRPAASSRGSEVSAQ